MEQELTEVLYYHQFFHEKGLRIFNKIIEYINELKREKFLLGEEGAVLIKNNKYLQIKTLNHEFILEIRYIIDKHLAVIDVYKRESSSKFSDKPVFELKTDCKIVFDKNLQIFIGGEKDPPHRFNDAPALIIKEILTKTQ